MKTTEAEFQKARSTHAHVAIMYEKYVTACDLGDDTAADACAEGIRRMVPPGLYEHWKSKEGDLKFYVVCDVLLEVDVHYPMVSYKSLYGKRASKAAGRHLHHQAEGGSPSKLSKEDRGFLTPIDRPEYRGPRFRLVAQLNSGEILKLIGYADELSIIADPIEFRVRAGELLKKKIPLF